MGDLSVFDNDKILSQLNPEIVLVGLNFSVGFIHIPFQNFHGKGGGAYKIRYALKDTSFWGAYMTDIIKDFEEKISGKVKDYLSKNRDFEKQNVAVFLEELNYIGAKNPILIAFGNEVYSILNRYLKDKFKIIKVPHYANYTNKEKYREQIRTICKF